MGFLCFLSICHFLFLPPLSPWVVWMLCDPTAFAVCFFHAPVLYLRSAIAQWQLVFLVPFCLSPPTLFSPSLSPYSLTDAVPGCFCCCSTLLLCSPCLLLVTLLCSVLMFCVPLLSIFPTCCWSPALFILLCPSQVLDRADSSTVPLAFSTGIYIIRR